MQNAHAFSLAGQPLFARPTGALWSPADRTLVVGDLHFGKSERLARRGGALLPPYETRATLTRLACDIDACAPARVVALGDSFDDAAAWEGIDLADRLTLTRLMAGREWVWVAGNHDPGPVAAGGTWLAECQLGALTCRHVATPDYPEISAHYHPKLRLRGVARPCFLIDAHRVILPAYGAYTGGMDCLLPPLAGLMAPGALAVLTGTRALPCPLPRAA
jgi:DNA ligase-associated metallophosphoesterase